MLPNDAPNFHIPPMRIYKTGATRDVSNNKLAYERFLAPSVLKLYAEYMHQCRLRNIPPGEEMRAPDNWKKGIPQSAYMDSLVRHVFEAWMDWHEGRVNKDTFCAILFNTMGMLFEELKKGINEPGNRPE